MDLGKTKNANHITEYINTNIYIIIYTNNNFNLTKHVIATARMFLEKWHKNMNNHALNREDDKYLSQELSSFCTSISVDTQGVECNLFGEGIQFHFNHPGYKKRKLV
jgi:predicted phosphohydrolase